MHEALTKVPPLGQDGKAPEPTLEFDKLFSELAAHWNHIGPRHRYELRLMFWRLICWLGGRPLTPVNLQTYQNWLLSERQSTYVHRCMRQIKLFTKFLTERGYLKVDPSLGLKKIQQIRKSPKAGYSPEDYKKMIRDENQMMVRYIIIAFHTGMSLVDVLELTWGDIDMDNLMIHKKRRKMATRNYATQHVPIDTDSHLYQLLLDARSNRRTNSPSDPLFPELKWDAIAARISSEPGTYVKHELLRLCARQGVTHQGTNGFRRGLISAMVRRPTANMTQVKHVSGHNSTSSLDPYIIADDETIKEAMMPTMKEFFAKTKEKPVKDMPRTTTDWSKIE